MITEGRGMAKFLMPLFASATIKTTNMLGLEFLIENPIPASTRKSKLVLTHDCHVHRSNSYIISLTQLL